MQYCLPYGIRSLFAIHRQSEFRSFSSPALCAMVFLPDELVLEVLWLVCATAVIITLPRKPIKVGARLFAMAAAGNDVDNSVAPAG